MDDIGWERLQALFHAAADLPAQERLAFLQAAADGDLQLIRDVLAMIDEDTGRSSLLDRDVAHVAGEILHEARAGDESHQRFGQYRVVDILGEGGMGIVYLAEREDLGNSVAIKVLRDAWMSPSRRERFAGEQRTLANLAHPHIARLYDADTLPDGTPWFAMEYVQGVPLTQYCRDRRSSIDERLKLVRSVCEAVRYAHSRAVIHRDLKPSNILVQADGTVKLLDFGIAKQLDTNDAPIDRTQTGLRMMTPAYAAPEQIRGEYAGVYTDVYALGVILFELLAGRLPFDLSNHTPGEVDLILTNADPAPLSKPTTGVMAVEAPDGGKASWADLDVLCRTAMHKAPERRYASVEALIRDIDHYLEGEPLEARRDTLGYRVGKFVRRNRRGVAIALLVLVSVAALVGFYMIRLRAARNAALAEAERSQQLLRFTLNLFNGGDEQAGPANDLRVSALVDRGAAEAATLNAEPKAQADVYETLGEVSQKLGQLDRANTFLNFAMDRRKAVFGSSSAPVAESQVRLGLLRADQAKFEDAERLVRQGLQWEKANLPPNHPAIAAATQALGKVLEGRGSYDAAIRVLEEAVRLRSSTGKETADLADSLLELANSHFYAGHYAQAEALNQQLLGIHRRIFGPRHPTIAEDLINLGAIQHELGHYREAESYHRQALEINLAFYGNNHYKTASNLTLIARALIKQNRYDEAIPLLRRALAIQEGVFGKVHPNVASAINDLGTAALAQGRFDEAEADFRRMVDIYRSVYAGKHYLIGIALANVGSVFMARKDYARAEQNYREALTMYAQTLPPDHLNVAITRIKLGRALLRENRPKEAEPESLGGYQVLSKQANPGVTWLQSARKDLAEIYTSLGESAKATAFETEQAAVAKDQSTAKK
ncbi:MAG TPA: tetratricopeptide repeat protein [Bryobacteraceae bacterium]|nr:tetratricopeptide repeat protein [Bryobacteraceae bacterium]